MNERIKQLAEQAGLRFTQLMSNPMVPVVDGKETDLEKFAELIIQACVKECQREWYDLNNAEDHDLEARAIAIRVGQKNGVLKSISRIKQHFGIK